EKKVIKKDIDKIDKDNIKEVKNNKEEIIANDKPQSNIQGSKQKKTL
ncbi:6488_t:CDS:1, partial [Racocetra persica]